MWIISTIFSIISIICFYQNIKFLIIIGAILVIVENLLNTIYGKQTNLVNLFISIFIGILFSLIFHHNILYFTCITICSVNIIEGILGILLIIFSLFFTKKCTKINEKKYFYLLDILKREINVKDIDEAIKKIYDFYTSQEIYIPFEYIVDKDNQTKLEYLEKILEIGMGTNNIDETIQKLENFYNK